MTYFAFWLILIFLINQFVGKIRLKKILTITLLSLSGLLSLGKILIGSLSDNIYSWKMEIEIGKLENWKIGNRIQVYLGGANQARLLQVSSRNGKRIKNERRAMAKNHRPNQPNRFYAFSKRLGSQASIYITYSA